MKNRWYWLGLVSLLAVACGDDSGKTSKGGNNSTCTDCQPDAGSREVSIGALSESLVEGTVVTVPIKLKLTPTADVRLNIVSLNQNEVTSDPPEMTFTAADWNATQLLTLTAIDDTAVTGDRQVEIEFSLVSEDPVFSNRNVNSLFVTVLEDDETPTINAETDGEFEVAEDGALKLEVTLSAQPSGDVLIPVSVDDESEATIDATQLTFDALNWNIAQEIMVTGKDDREADGDQTFNVVFGPTNSEDELFNQLPESKLPILAIDGVCGNSVVDGAEACEPTGSPSTTCDYGERSCTYCSATCESQAGTPAGYCGDGTVQAGEEQCDEAATRCAYGQMSCQSCNNCEWGAGQTSGYCGDGVVQSAQEECDPGISACCNNSCQTDVTDCAPDCLIISEYYEGSNMNKAVEIYNCSNTSASLAGVNLCIIRNADFSCTASYTFTGSLPAGATKTLCNSQLSHPGDAACDLRESNVTQFNGDDRLMLYVDIDGNRQFNGVDPIVDAFGQTVFRDTSEPWKDIGFSRCNFTEYNGISTFSLASYWTTLNVQLNNEMDGFGVAPTEPCF